MKVKRGAAAKQERELEFLVDFGAIHSVVPREILRELRVRPFKKTSFVLANGGSVERKVGTAHLVYKKHEGGAPVIFGEKGDHPLLSATTLEAMELALNPLMRELHPLEMTLMGDASLWTGPPGVPISKRRRGLI